MAPKGITKAGKLAKSVKKKAMKAKGEASESGGSG
jgi:hypothetical protein